MSVMVISGPIAAADVPGLCERAVQLLAGGADVLVCDVAALRRPDAATVDALARLQLTARRLGREIRLRRPSPELRELLDLFGLREVVPEDADATRADDPAGRTAGTASPCPGTS
jgi:ABC-type transporter Mla MlaB component